MTQEDWKQCKALLTPNFGLAYWLQDLTSSKGLVLGMLASMLSLRGTESSFSCGFFHELYGDSWESLATIVPGTWAMPLLKPVPTLPFVFCQLARLTCLTDGVLLPCKWFSYTGVKMSQASSSLAVAHPGVFGSTHKHCRYRHLPA